MNNTNNANGTIELTLEERFEIYLDESPELWTIFKQFAEIALSKGFTNYSAAAIFQIIRWETGAQGAGQYKINNTFYPYFARKLMAEDARFDRFFRTRKLHAEKVEDLNYNLNYKLVS